MNRIEKVAIATTATLLVSSMMAFAFAALLSTSFGAHITPFVRIDEIFAEGVAWVTLGAGTVCLFVSMITIK